MTIKPGHTLILALVLLTALVSFKAASPTSTGQAANEYQPRLITNPDPPLLKAQHLNASVPDADEPVDEEWLSYVPDELLIKVGSQEEFLALLRLAQAHGGDLVDAVGALKTIRLRFDSLAQTATFRDHLGDAYQAENNHLVKAPDYPEYETRPDEDQTLVHFGADALAWLGVSGDHSQWGESVLIAVLDTGVNAHPTFEGMSVMQLDLLGDTESPVTEYDGHGTAVASIVAQVAPAAEILSVRVLDSEGLGDSYTVAMGIVAAVDEGASVINLSIGTYSDSAVLSEAVAYAVGQGVAVIAASGNDGSNAPTYPAAYEGVAGVSALDADAQIAGFSNYGDSVDLAAPGVGVYAAWQDSSAIAMSGTSAAAPFVSGAAAALLSEGRASTGVEAISMLEASAVDLGNAGVDADFGNGALQLGTLF
jgi:subtilisin family serine protease